jgi:hypothetical protein
MKIGASLTEVARLTNAYLAYTGQGQNFGSAGERVERGTQGLLAHVLSCGRAHGDRHGHARRQRSELVDQEIQRSRESIDTA